MPPCRPLPYILPSIPGEILSSWLRRIAAEYGVELRHLTAHFGLSVSRAWEIDRALSADDVRRIALALRTDPAEIRDMVHVVGMRILHPTSAPLQVCAQCRAGHRAATRLPVTIRAWFEFWQIECERCRTPFSPTGRPNLTRCNPAREEPVWFESLRPAARVGARLSERWRDNLLPDPWTSDRPVRLVTARTILLAGMATFLSNRDAAVDLLSSAAPCVSHTGFRPTLISLSSGTGMA
jgi:hypothetical protein